MTIQELRIGNYIQWNGQPKRIEAILNNKVLIRKKNKQSVWVEISKVKPLGITEDLLLKMGLTINILPYVYFFKEPNFCSICVSSRKDSKGSSFYLRGLGYTIKNVNYIHKVQNLYFESCEKELEFTL